MVTTAHNKCVERLLRLTEVAARLVDGGSKDVAGEQSSGVSVDINEQLALLYDDYLFFVADVQWNFHAWL